MPNLKLDHLTLLVTSIKASRPFYEALLPLLGFHRTTRENWTDGQGFFFQFMEAKPDTRPYERYGAGLNHMGFGAPDAATVEAIRAAMIAAGLETPEIQNLGGAKALFLRDPDGLRFEITWYPPGVAVVD
jgi:lactoylglutathione lyase